MVNIKMANRMIDLLNNFELIIIPDDSENLKQIRTCREVPSAAKGEQAKWFLIEKDLDVSTMKMKCLW